MHEASAKRAKRFHQPRVSRSPLTLCAKKNSGYSAGCKKNKGVVQGGGGRLYCFPITFIDPFRVPVWRHTATGECFASLLQISVGRHRGDSLRSCFLPIIPFMSLTGRGHGTFLCRITCKKARIWTFFWLDRKQYGWFALFRLAKMQPSVSCCWFQCAFLLA